LNVLRVQIERSGPVRLGTDPANPVCGYRYFARVVEHLKGGQKPFSFFAGTDKLMAGREYLVFLHKTPSNTGGTIDRLEDLQTSPDQKMLACKMGAADYLLPVGRQTYFEFDQDAAKRFGSGEWLAPRDPRNALGFTWCNSDWPLNARPPKRNILRTQNVEIGNTMVRYVAWQSARQLIRDALKNPPFWWGGIPNPMFRPGAC
jgi:hypothetical protein